MYFSLRLNGFSVWWVVYYNIVSIGVHD